MMKRIIACLIFCCLLSFLMIPVLAESSDPSAFLSILTEGKTNWYFTGDPVNDSDLHTILEAGVNTASAINEQPWVITVITDSEIIAQLADTTSSAKAPVMILVSVTSSNEMKILDAGLAVQSMQIAARALGYATKIETAPARAVRNDHSGEWAAKLGIPADKAARAALFIGHADGTADAVTSASARNDFDSVVHFVTGK
ncbi:MAG: nitroreductase family protein [Clostridia bacterium]|nr:nitroreductase family protein [Clostridia bacterium]